MTPALIKGKLFVRFPFWISFPDRIFWVDLGQFCAFQSGVAIVIYCNCYLLHFMREKRLPGAPEPLGSHGTKELPTFSSFLTRASLECWDELSKALESPSGH